jgi:hypothetical protein
MIRHYFLHVLPRPQKSVLGIRRMQSQRTTHKQMRRPESLPLESLTECDLRTDQNQMQSKDRNGRMDQLFCFSTRTALWSNIDLNPIATEKFSTCPQTKTFLPLYVQDNFVPTTTHMKYATVVSHHVLICLLFCKV